MIINLSLEEEDVQKIIDFLQNCGDEERQLASDLYREMNEQISSSIDAEDRGHEMDREDREPREDHFRSDVEADMDALESAGFGEGERDFDERL